MIAIDELYAAVRLALLADAGFVSYVPGGLLQGRQTQTTATSGVGQSERGYGIISLTPLNETPSSAMQFRDYQLTVIVYLTSDSARQANVSTSMAGILDFANGVTAINAQLTTASAITRGAVLMVTPKPTDQKIEQKMKGPSDMTTVIGTWLVKVVESRA